MTDLMTLTESLDRARSPMLASAVGDALGWPIENRSGLVGGVSRVQPRLELINWVRREGGRYAPHEVEIEAGSYSDDTQLTLAVARSRLRGDAWWQHWTEFELPMWLVYERGGGGASKRAAQAWSRGKAPWSEELKSADRERYFEAGGNGVAMRILPHVLIAYSEDFGVPAADIFSDGLCTHGHPRALLGALAHGYALWLALNHRQEQALGFGELVERTIEGEQHWGRVPALPPALSEWQEQVETTRPQFSQTWERTREEMLDLLAVCRNSLGRGSLAVDRETLDGIGAFDPKANGAGTIAAAAAVFLASRYASQPGQGLTAAAFAKGADTDTIAAMTGGLLGAIHRDGWLAGLRAEVQDARYIDALAGELSKGATKSLPVAEPWRQADRRELWNQLEEMETGAVFELPVFGHSKLARIRPMQTKSSNIIREWVLHTGEGLTLFVKRVSPAKDRDVTSTSAGPLSPAWIVCQTADLSRSERFYSKTIGLPTRLDSGSNRIWVSDRLVFEAAKPGWRPSASPKDEPDLLDRGQAVTFFRNEHDLAATHKRLVEAGEFPVSGLLERDGRSAFRCADPDGYVVEIRATPK